MGFEMQSFMILQFNRLLVLLAFINSFIVGGSACLRADEADMRPGLLCVISNGPRSVTRIDRRLNFDWTDSLIESRLADVKSLTWSGNLLVRSGGPHTFHAQVSGSLAISVDDKIVFLAEGTNVFASGNEVDLTTGDHRIQIEFQTSLKQPDARPLDDFRMQLFWSSPEFTLEPLPADVLTHLAGSDAAHAQHGRMLVDALRCAACHTGLEELPVLKAPSLHRLRGNTPAADIVRRLTHPETMRAWSSMPTFGFSDSEANDVAAFLVDASEMSGESFERKAELKPDDVDAGQRLLLTTGCAACHAMAQLPNGYEPQAAPYHGPDLSNVAERRDVAWLTTWLTTPQAINTDHRMPVFTLSDDELRQIVAALVQTSDRIQKKSDDEATSDAAAIRRGRELVNNANCASCHRIPGLETPKVSRLRPLADAARVQGHSCLAEKSQTEIASTSRLPRFELNEIQRDQIRAWLATLNASLPATSQFTRGEFLLHRNGCVACHDRDQQTGLSTMASRIEARRNDLRGQSQALIPPPLTAVGDRLQDDYLLRAVAGEQGQRRLPWLLVRMPRFELSQEDRSGIMRYFVGSDRIPESADVARRELFTHLDPQHPTIATAQELLVGNQLVGAGGFNCIACHSAGAYEPKNVAMGTRGSDVMTIGQRVRSRYFMRWMRNPIRVVPGIEMPAIRKSVSGVLEESLSQQIAVLWKSLADPSFSPPTVVSRYEQFVTLSPGDRPRVIRDVFTLGDSKAREGVARAFAVGFDNGHNLLLDLDSLQLKQWTIGEFARQRTEGKSWFWDMAGVTLWQAGGDHLSMSLVNTNEPDALPLHMVIDERRQAELLSYRVDGHIVSLRMRLYFDQQRPDGKSDRDLPTHSPITAWNDPDRSLIQTVLNFALKPIPADKNRSGWRWQVALEECPESWALQLDLKASQKSHGEIPWTVSFVSSDENAAFETTRRLRKGQDMTLQYLCDVMPTNVSPPPLAKQISVSDPITAVPGFHGRRLPIGTAIMPTGIAWLADGRMAMTSLKGDVWILSDTDGDSLPDSMSLFADGLSAPYGIQVDGDSLVVAHKPEVLRLRDSDGDGRADEFDVVASGWGFSDDYHDWTTALLRDLNGDWFVGLGSDYSQNQRPADNDRWRGTILKIDSTGTIAPIATAFRFPMGLAFDRSQNLFATDNQGVQNTFNEINHVVSGKHYGVPSRHEGTTDMQSETPALMVPHPWTRSVNSILFLPDNFANPDLAGHGLGCEYDTRCLIRFTIQDVDGVQQGACYRFSRPDQPGGGGNFVGPVTSAVGPDGALYIGSIWDSGWQGGANTGSIERLTADTSMPNGIREIRATASGFEVTFFKGLTNISLMRNPATWSIQGYTRLWRGSYATPDAEQYTLTPNTVELSDDCSTVILAVQPLKAGFVYEIGIDQSAAMPESLWPAEGFYSMKVVPGDRFRPAE